MCQEIPGKIRSLLFGRLSPQIFPLLEGLSSGLKGLFGLSPLGLNLHLLQLLFLFRSGSWQGR